jgi:UDP-N-acetylglucosamine--N-acetylmuramyl-(pentapeptide) pyrophosphoryl-undecaprenol N-acetylglucosamine transferase
VAFEPTTLPHAVVTGAPIRRPVASIDRQRDRAEARAALEVDPDRFLVVAFGGSLGSGKINTVIDQFVARHGGRKDLAVRHIVGARNRDEARQPRAAADGLQYQVVDFEEHMERCLAGCDLLVARAGASTVAEVGAVGVPSVLVPWKDAAADHQTANARSLADVGGAVMVTEAEFDEPWLSALVEAYLNDPQSREQLGQRAAAAGRRDGATRIAALALEVASGV